MITHTFLPILHRKQSATQTKMIVITMRMVISAITNGG